jgi:hypothetical protein
MLSHLSESLLMDTWQIIEEALIHMRPRRTMLWLSEQLGVSIQVVSNWKARGGPASRRREIATALGMSVDQLDGLTPLPWEESAGSLVKTDLFPDVASTAKAINQLPKRQRDWVLSVVQTTIDAARATIPVTGNGVTHSDDERPRRRGNG